MTTKTEAAPRIDKLAVGSIVELNLFTNSRDVDCIQKVMFLGIEGEGTERTAKFMMLAGDRTSTYTWEAYRYNGKWAWGASADILRLERVVATPADLLG